MFSVAAPSFNYQQQRAMTCTELFTLHSISPGVWGSLNGFLLELSVQGDGTITLLEKKVSIAFCARSSNSEL